MGTATATADIRKLSEREFDAFRPVRGPFGSLVANEKEWYADRRGNVIGALILDRIDKDWSYVILGRDQRGRFRAIDAQVSFESPDRARELLLTQLRRFSRSGKKVFRQ